LTLTLTLAEVDRSPYSAHLASTPKLTDWLTACDRCVLSGGQPRCSW